MGKDQARRSPSSPGRAVQLLKCYRRALGATLLTILLSLPATAQQPDGIMVWGAGATSCGEFLKAMNENPRSEVAFGQWLHGYITARNFLDLKAVDYAAGVDRAGLFAWITNHCKSHPLDSFFWATEALIAELKAKDRIRQR